MNRKGIFLFAVALLLFFSCKKTGLEENNYSSLFGNNITKIDGLADLLKIPALKDSLKMAIDINGYH